MKFSSESLFTIALIPDEREFKEIIIDDFIAWLAADDANSRLKSFEMIEADCEVRFFQKRKLELECYRDEALHQRILQFQQEVADLEKTTPPVSQLGVPHQVEAKQQQWIEAAISKRQAALDDDLKLIAGRFNTLLLQCSDRITNAQASYDQAYHRWQENHKNDLNVG